MLKIAVPMTLAQLINVLYNIVDRIFIGRIPVDATNALTGLGVAFPICTITIAFANLVGSGGAPLFSIERGRGNNEEAEKILCASFRLLLIFGIIIFILGYLTKAPLLYLLGASSATFAYADSYISIYLLGTVFVMLSLGMNSFINAQGFARTGMLTVTIGAVCNLILDPIFIFAAGMGVQGAALATVISQFLAAVWTIRFLTGKKTLIRLILWPTKHILQEKPGKRGGETGADPILSGKRVKNILTLGLSGFIMSITNCAVQIVCNVNLSVYGGDMYIAAMTIINSVREVVQMAVSGIGNGAQPVLSFNYGAGEKERVKGTIKLMGAALLAYTMLAWIVVMVFAGQFVRLFNNDAKLFPVAVSSMHIYFFGFFMMAFQMAGQTVFQSLGKAKQAIFFSLLRKVFIVIPLTCLLPLAPEIGVTGVFLAEPVSNFIGGLACFLTMYVTVYRKLR